MKRWSSQSACTQILRLEFRPSAHTQKPSMTVHTYYSSNGKGRIISWATWPAFLAEWVSSRFLWATLSQKLRCKLLEERTLYDLRPLCACSTSVYAPTQTCKYTYAKKGPSEDVWNPRPLTFTWPKCPWNVCCMQWHWDSEWRNWHSIDNGLWNLPKVSVFWLVLAGSCCWLSEGHRRFQLHNNNKKEGPGCVMAQWLNPDGPVKTLGPIPITAQKDKWKNRPRAWRLASVCPHTLPPGRASFKGQLNQWASKHDLTKPNIWILRKREP